MKKVIQLFFIISFTIFAVACSDSNTTPEATAETIYKHIAAGNTDKVIELMYLPSDQDKDQQIKQMVTSKMSMVMQEQKKKYDQAGGIDSIKANSVTYNDDKTQANVVVIIKTKDGQESKDNMKLIKVNGKWLVNIR